MKPLETYIEKHLISNKKKLTVFEIIGNKSITLYITRDNAAGALAGGRVTLQLCGACFFFAEISISCLVIIIRRIHIVAKGVIFFFRNDQPILQPSTTAYFVIAYKILLDRYDEIYGHRVITILYIGIHIKRSTDTGRAGRFLGNNISPIRNPRGCNAQSVYNVIQFLHRAIVMLCCSCFFFTASYKQKLLLLFEKKKKKTEYDKLFGIYI